MAPEPTVVDGPAHAGRPADGVAKRGGDHAARSSAAPGPVGARAALAAVALAALVVGVWIRLWLLAHVGIQSDQATAGLMAEQILGGHFYALFWGQHYGGVEPYAVAALFGVFGRHAYLINLAATVLVAAASVLVWRLGRLAFGRSAVAAFAACLVWVWPWAALWSSTRDTGFRAVTLLCGIGTLVAAYRVVLRGSHVLDWALLGGAAGVGLWSSVEIAYFAVPVVLLLVTSIVRRTLGVTVRGLGSGIAGFAAGVAPWLVDNLHTGFASLRTTAIGPATTYGTRLDLFFTQMLPVQLGLKTATGLLGQRTPVRWVFGTPGSEVLFAFLAVVILIGIVGVVAAARLEAKVLVSFVLAFPLVFAALPPTDNWYDGRYGVLLPPVLILLVVHGWTLLVGEVRRRRHSETAPSPRTRRRVARAPWPAVAAAALAVAVLTAATGYVFSEEAPRARVGQTLAQIGEDGTDGVVRALERGGARAVVADYWAAYDLDFLSKGMLRVTPLEAVRVPSTFRTVMSGRAAWLFVGPGKGDAQAARGDFQSLQPGPATMTLGWFTDTLRTLGVAYTTLRAGPMVAVRPAARSAGWLLAKVGPLWAHSPLNRHGLLPSPRCRCGSGP